MPRRYSDGDRLPDGFDIFHYDADIGRYYARDEDGSIWESNSKVGVWNRSSGPVTQAGPSVSVTNTQGSTIQANQAGQAGQGSQQGGQQGSQAGQLRRTVTSDPRRFSTFVDPKSLRAPSPPIVSPIRSSFRKSIAKGAIKAVMSIKRMASTKKRSNSQPPDRPEDRPGYTARRVTDQDVRSNPGK
ncbi:hypothetical protein ABKA04_000668 [Annulohypoxylon sp. FPYF3050]